MLHEQVLIPRLEDASATLARKIASVTATLEPSYGKLLGNIIPSNNANTICDYILAEITENNIKDSTKEWKIKVLVYLSKFLPHGSVETI